MCLLTGAGEAGGRQNGQEGAAATLECGDGGAQGRAATVHPEPVEVEGQNVCAALCQCSRSVEPPLSGAARQLVSHVAAGDVALSADKTESYWY